MEINLSESDFDPALIAKIAAEKDGATVLGASLRDDLLRAMPKVIASKLNQIVPPDFKISEVSMKLSLKGSVFGSSVGGDVNVKFVPGNS